jgi:hypothetical protein
MWQYISHTTTAVRTSNPEYNKVSAIGIIRVTVLSWYYYYYYYYYHHHHHHHHHHYFHYYHY